MPRHHPEDLMLMEYAAGTLGEATALVVATHLALCPACRQAVRLWEAIGGSLVGELEPAFISGAVWSRLAARLDEAEPGEGEEGQQRAPVDHRPWLPRPLRDHIGGGPDTIAWRWHGRSVATCPVLASACGQTVRLLRIRAGAAVPAHGHRGEEGTLVLRGAFSDEYGYYGTGDVVFADAGVTHRPEAGREEDCICLVVTDAPLRFKGPAGPIFDLLAP